MLAETEKLGPPHFSWHSPSAFPRPEPVVRWQCPLRVHEFRPMAKQMPPLTVVALARVAKARFNFDDLQGMHLPDSVKIGVTVEHRQPVCEGHLRDEAVDGFSNGDSLAAAFAVYPGSAEIVLRRARVEPGQG